MSDAVKEARALLDNANTHKYEPEPEGKSICVKCGADGWNRHRPCRIDYHPLPRLVRTLVDDYERVEVQLGAEREMRHVESMAHEALRAAFDKERAARDAADAEIAQLVAENKLLRDAQKSQEESMGIDPEKFVLLDFYTGNGVYAASIGDKESSHRITSQKASPGTTIRSFRVLAGDIMDALRSYAKSEPTVDSND